MAYIPVAGRYDDVPDHKRHVTCVAMTRTRLLRMRMRNQEEAQFPEELLRVAPKWST